MKHQSVRLAAFALIASFACSAADNDAGQRSEPSEPGSLSVATALGAQSDAKLDGYAKVTEPRRLVFPQDHGAHPEYKTEWWYWIGNLETEGGRRFGYQLTFFRSALAPEAPEAPEPPEPAEPPEVLPSQQAPAAASGSPWRTRQLYMAHLAVSDIDENGFYSFERFGRDSASLSGTRSMPFRVWLEDWSVEEAKAGESSGDSGRWILRAGEGSFELELELAPGKPRVLHGEAGFSRKGDTPGAASYYYSRTRMPTRGRLTLDGNDHAVEGSSWFDREWSTSLLARHEVGWDWLGAQLDDGRELMFFRLRRDDGTSARVDGTLVEAGGASRVLDTTGFDLSPRGAWTSPETGVTYPASFHLELPAEELAIDVNPLLEDQELRLSFVYWEGAVEISGTASGRGYLEMTGYGD